MSQYVVAIILDKVQNFLYQTFKSNTVEDQKEADTLQKVIQASNELSSRFPKEVKEIFEKKGCPIREKDEIVFTSGKIIFNTELSENKIEECLQELFRYYYLREIEQPQENIQPKGQMRLNYTYFDLKSEEIKRFEFEHGLATDLDNKMRVIKIATIKLKSVITMSKVIEANATTLFEFPKNKINIVKPLSINEKLRDGTFAKNIDELKKELTQGENETEESDFFRIAVIKADLDGMGDLFESLENYDEYKNVSKVLNDYICVGKLHELMKKQGERKRQNKSHDYFKLLPLYVAGDDIFFIANVAHIFTAIDLLNRWLYLINAELEKSFENPLSLSVGIDVVAHSLPLRYMYDQVELQLDHAKKYKSNTGNVKMNISIYNQIFHIFKNTKTQILRNDSKSDREKKEKKIKKEIEGLKKNLKAEGKNFDNGWSRFRREVVLIQKGSDLEGTESRESMVGFSYLYNLLEKSTKSQFENNDQKHANIILDQLVPSLEEKTHSNQVKNVLINQLILEYNPDEKFRERKLMFDKSYYKEKFERKLRLFLLFSSERYKSFVRDIPENDSDLKSSLILKPSRHLYNLIKESEIGELFIKFSQSDKIDKNGEVEKDKKGKVIKTDYYQILPIKTSMFHKLKKFHKKGEIDKSAEAIFNVVDGFMKMKNDNKDDNVDIQKSNKNGREYDRDFKIEQKDRFIKLAKEDKNWNEDVIDSLMILYKYIDVLQHWSEQKGNGGSSK